MENFADAFVRADLEGAGVPPDRIDEDRASERYAWRDAEARAMKAEPPTADEALLVRGWRAFRLVNALWFRPVSYTHLTLPTNREV